MDIVRHIGDTAELPEKLANLKQDPFPDTPVIFAKIKLLWQCNLSCIFCERPKHVKPLPKEIVDAMLDSLLRLGLQKVHFSGGELFLHPEILPILDLACSHVAQVNLTSNGTLITKKIARAIADMGVHSVSLSLDSSRDDLHDKIRGAKGSYKSTVKAIYEILRYRKKYPGIRINTVVTKLNFDDLGNIHQMLKSMSGGVSWKLIPVDSSNKKLILDEARMLELTRQAGTWDLIDDSPIESSDCGYKSFSRGLYAFNYYKARPCYMPWLHIFVDPLGFVYPCCMTRGRISAMGRFPEESFESIIKGERSRELRMNMASGRAFEICHHCDDFIGENKGIYEMLRHRSGVKIK